ncbi:ISAs1-like element ISCbu1 family transposase [Coxiella burnetii]|uniref:ISAs1-like element ISCbu1 family transposase n=1 Tax=Coxiella burnetii TaxID=777 RepID=UPI0000DAEBA8|nr:ISAs1-like element ISCbu1 family transposase [Coxiella burnetii]ABX78595.1 transposase (IS4 family) [Coxiella burnetii RSA 331]
MEKTTCKSLKNQYLFHCFLSIKDPRVPGRCIYPLINILLITLCALICGVDTWKGIADFGKKRYRWLSQFVDMRCGVPSALTFARVFSLIEPEQFQHCLSAWMSQFFQLLRFDMIHLDGKSLCGSARRGKAQKATHIVNAYLPKEQVTLGEVRVPDKSNEIKAIPILLNSLNVQGCIISIDAMGTQKGIANLIRLKQADYVLALKKNHTRFYRYVERLFSCSDERDYQGMCYRTEETKDYGHARIEERSYCVLPMMYLHKYKKYWRDLQAIVRVQSKRHKGNEIETATRYYITSLPFAEHRRMSQAIRQHWAIENQLHWKLDIGLDEDASLITRGYADQNLATLRKMVLKMLENENSSKQGIAGKRIQAALSTRYLRKVVGF